jgi:hypothetical protein
MVHLSHLSHLSQRRLKRKLGRAHDPDNAQCNCPQCRQKIYTARNMARLKKKRLAAVAAPPRTGKYEVTNLTILKFLRGKKR